MNIQISHPQKIKVEIRIGSTIDGRTVGLVEGGYLQLHRGTGTVGIANLPCNDWSVEHYGSSPSCDYEEYGQYISNDEREFEIRFLKELAKQRNSDVFMILPATVVPEDQQQHLNDYKAQDALTSNGVLPNSCGADPLTIHVDLTAISVEGRCFAPEEDTDDIESWDYEVLEQVRQECERLLSDGIDCSIDLSLFDYACRGTSARAPYLVLMREVIERCVALRLNETIQAYCNGLQLYAANFNFYSSGGSLVK